MLESQRLWQCGTHLTTSQSRPINGTVASTSLSRCAALHCSIRAHFVELLMAGRRRKHEIQTLAFMDCQHQSLQDSVRSTQPPRFTAPDGKNIKECGHRASLWLVGFRPGSKDNGSEERGQKAG